MGAAGRIRPGYHGGTALTNPTRRGFLAGVGMAAVAGGTLSSHAEERRRRPRLLFVSQGKTLAIQPDGAGLRPFEFQAPNQATWQPGPQFSDGRRLVMLSMEPRRDGPGRPFSEYYHKTPTHIWVHDLETGSLMEVANKERMAVFYTPALLLNDSRMLVQVIKESGVGQIYSMNLDGTDAREFTRAGEGLPYGFSASPDGKRVAYHLASPQSYQIWTCDGDGANRVRVAAAPGHLYFGTQWSPNGKWVVYVDCLSPQDPGHDWADVCVGRPDGSEHRVLTQGQAMWFAATYGRPGNRGSGSNVPTWSRDGQILFPRRLPGSRVPWEFQPQRPDTDHFNRDYKPDLARGGTEICKLHPETGKVTVLTQSDPPVWDFRCTESADGRYIAFCRCATGELPALWVMRGDGKGAKR
ncbi:MAG: twin-arginine translocation signal domain-containing protein, partial [Armatimonadetes bacterium]|nr:twin-arginine translocation signal domain-containing protein [Armatimonadota bacterium]